MGLLGAGYICDAHAQSLLRIAGVELVAVCDRAQDKAAAVARKYGIPGVYTSFDEMLAGEVDVVHVLLPPDLHFDAARRILESGRHVFLEKPMALTAAECDTLDALAAEKNLQLAVNHNFLFLPSYEKLRRDAADRTLGNPALISINWLFPLPLVQTGPFDNWILRRPQNLFLELAPHLLAFAIDLVGPLTRLQVDVSHPLDLPGGNRVYRSWRVHGSKSGTAIDLTLGVLPGYGDRSVTVHAHGATAKCDYARNIYYRDEPGRYGAVINNLTTGLRMAGQIAITSMRNFFKAAINTLQKKPAANPYGESIERSIRAFYRVDGGVRDSRLTARFGAEVVRACEQVVRSANLNSSGNSHTQEIAKSPLALPTILVVGGTGFIGKYLVKSLVERGHAVRVVTRSMSAAKFALAGLPVEVVAGDLADAEFMDKALTGIEVVYHLAKAAGKTWEDYYRQDVLVTRNIAERALVKGIKRFIYTGTIDSYYSGDENDVITGDSPLDPKIDVRNHYGRAKACCEEQLRKLHRERGLPLVIFRPGIVIGRGCPPAHWGVGMFQSDTCMRFWGGGSHKLPLVLVEDVAQALALALDKPGIEGSVFLLTDDPLLSARDYVEAASRACGTRIRAEATPVWKFYAADLIKEAAKHLIRHPHRRVPSYRDWKSRSHVARYDSSKTKAVLGWRPAGTREALIERGIVLPARDYVR